ncbi:zinc finger protein ZAT9-like [Macadamia integrifolia]|uniref:zinc finger protein ZAT9-like n=1 Tax=Macadamia integrifolia TaxID=60698 RepID=UPI001C4E9E42|nr:zinc finger protein ZAT9-like [Macadamia integrifolia]
MALVVDQQPNFKYYCRICKKGFGCGRALGGHMRAHGIGDETGHMDDDDPAADWDPPPGTKRMYALRTNPNRLKNCRICENCGKEFSSWKAFLEHGKCSSDDAAAESLVSSPGSDDDDDVEDGRRGCGWSKGKRSRRLKLGITNSNCPSSEDEDLANCLVMLSTARVDPLVAETESSCASASKDEEQRRNLAAPPPAINRLSADKAKGVVRGMFECKACKKVFNSHQALGGHRASHKKVKGCFAAKLDDLDESQVDEDVITNDDFSIPSKSIAIIPYDQTSLAVPSKRKSKVHECSICHRVFSSGQALGGHKRCHWVTSNSPDTSSIPKFHHQLEEHQRPNFINKSEPLDLNLPAPIDEIAGVRQDSDNLLSFEVPTAIYLQPWIGVHSNSNNNNHNHHHHHHHHHHHQHQNNDNNNSNSNSNNNQTNNNNNNTITTTTNNAKSTTSGINVDDEADSKVKLAKLSDLKDMNLGGGSSPWLQVGIGSTANGSIDP